MIGSNLVTDIYVAVGVESYCYYISRKYVCFLYFLTIIEKDFDLSTELTTY